MCLTLNFRIKEKASTWRNTKLTTHEYKEVTEGRNVGERKTREMVLVSGPQEDNFRWVWSLYSCHPIKGDCHTVCSSVPPCQPCLAPKSRAEQTAALPQHTHSSCVGSKRGTTHPLLGSAAPMAHLQVTASSSHQHSPCSAHLSQTLELLPRPLCRAPPFSHPAQPQPPAHQDPHCLCHGSTPQPESTAAPASPTALPGKRWELHLSQAPTENRGATFPAGTAQRTHCIFPTWLGWVK